MDFHYILTISKEGEEAPDLRITRNRDGCIITLGRVLPGSDVELRRAITVLDDADSEQRNLCCSLSARLFPPIKGRA